MWIQGAAGESQLQREEQWDRHVEPRTLPKKHGKNQVYRFVDLLCLFNISRPLITTRYCFVQDSLVGLGSTFGETHEKKHLELGKEETI